MAVENWGLKAPHVPRVMAAVLQYTNTSLTLAVCPSGTATDARHSSEVELGNDLCLLRVW